MPKPKLLAREFLHSCKVKLYNGSGVAVSENLYYDNGSIVPNVRYLKNTPRPVYITKPEYRNHAYKKEFEEVHKLDKYLLPDHDLDKAITQILNGGKPVSNSYTNTIKTSPYVYLADQDIQVFIKHRYRKLFQESKVAPKAATTGFFDVENDIDKNKFSAISCTHENHVYTALLKEYCKKNDGTPFDLDYINDLYEQYIPGIIQKEVDAHPKINTPGRFPFKHTIKIFDTEFEMIQWIFGMMHVNKTAFVGIWNINYDIPMVIDFLRRNGIDESSVFVHPDVPKEFRQVYYQFDKQTAEKKNAHPSDYWHWFHTPGYTQFLDSMALYARNRKASVKESSYKLDDILKKSGFGGKLKFQHLSHLDKLSNQDWHRKMSNEHFPEYVLYNIIDVVGLQLMEWFNGDIGSMITLSENTPISKYSKETRKLVTDYATRWIDRGWALGCSRKNMAESWDKYLPAIGGTVLDPNRIINRGLMIYNDFKYHRSRAYGYVNDVDFKSIYPSVLAELNISKDTKLYTVISIEGEHVKWSGYQSVEVFFSAIRNQREEAQRLATQYYNQLGFGEMEALVAERLGLNNKLE